MSNVFGRACTAFVVLVGLAIGGCGSSLGGPSAIPEGQPTQGAELGRSSVQAVSSGRQVTDETLANAGWTCFQPGNGLILCAPPGLGLPPLPPTGEGRPTYDIMAFTLDHQFVHQVKLRRPDLPHDVPCLGGGPWTLVPVINYYECIIPPRGGSE